MKKAVLLVTFNRLDTTKRVFEQIAIAKPPRLYLASDGPRVDRPDDKEKVDEIRKWLLDNVNWDCDVKTKFEEQNIGGDLNSTEAISWMFENEEDGIFLEDDDVPNQSFFRFCEEMLDYYKDDMRIWQIAGTAFYEKKNVPETYYFGTANVWGMATWANRWKYFDYKMKDCHKNSIERFAKKQDKNVLKWLLGAYDWQKKSDNSFWDGKWELILMEHNALSVIPCKNLICNIGNVGLHMNDVNGTSPLLNRATYEIKEIIHPKKVTLDIKSLNEKGYKVWDVKKYSIFNKEIYKYCWQHPLFLFRKDFWKYLM